MTLEGDASKAKRLLLRKVPYGMYVITAKGEDGTFNGFTANWITQAGFDPPMVALAVANDAYTLPLIKSGKRFAINFIKNDSVSFLRGLARPYHKAPDKFDDIELAESANGTPILADSVGYLEVSVNGNVEYGGDHQIVVGEVTDAGVINEDEIQTMHAAGMKYSG